MKDETMVEFGGDYPVCVRRDRIYAYGRSDGEEWSWIAVEGLDRIGINMSYEEMAKLVKGIADESDQ